jgi:hypothetical protein
MNRYGRDFVKHHYQPLGSIGIPRFRLSVNPLTLGGDLGSKGASSPKSAIEVEGVSMQ